MLASRRRRIKNRKKKKREIVVVSKAYIQYKVSKDESAVHGGIIETCGWPIVLLPSKYWFKLWCRVLAKSPQHSSSSWRWDVCQQEKMAVINHYFIKEHTVGFRIRLFLSGGPSGLSWNLERKKKEMLPRRELNPGLLGESQVS